MKKAIRVIEVLVSKNILKIYCKSSFECLIAKDTMGDSKAESFSGVRLGVEDSSNSFILLSMREKT